MSQSLEPVNLFSYTARGLGRCDYIKVLEMGGYPGHLDIYLGPLYLRESPKAKKLIASQINREIQIKTTVRHHLIPIQMATVKQQRNKCWCECG